jgi:hypothetical protein
VPAYRRDPARPLERVGDVVVVSNHYAPGGAAPLAVLIGNCVRLTVEDVRIWSASHIAVFEGGCEDVVYRRVTIDRCPPENDYRPRAVPRYRSANRDGFHLLGNRGRTVLEDCTARFMDDDGVNVHGAAQLITACEGTRLRILDKHGARVVHPGDRVELIGFDGQRLGPANIVAIEKTDPPTETEKTFYETYMPTMLAPSRAWTVTLDRAPEAGLGSLIYPADRVGNQCVIRNSRFGYGRSRGIVLRGSQARIENCVIEGNWQKGVMITGELCSLEGGFPTNVVITGNRIASLRNEAVDVAYVTPDGAPAPVGLFRDITITRNRLEGATAGVRLIGVDGVVIRGNTFTTTTPAVRTQNCARIVSDVACAPLDRAAATPPAR